MSKKITEHRDKLGQILNVGDAVCYPYRSSLEFGTVKTLYPKMVKVWEVGQHMRYYTGNNKYPQDLVKVEGPAVTMYLLRANSTVDRVAN
jgi:hypothetical protein